MLADTSRGHISDGAKPFGVLDMAGNVGVTNDLQRGVLRTCRCAKSSKTARACDVGCGSLAMVDQHPWRNARQ
jgi:hypothetical protein